MTYIGVPIITITIKLKPYKIHTTALLSSFITNKNLKTINNYLR